MSTFSAAILEVVVGEDGMKLLRFLERRLVGPPPKTALHKWIRTGQVRVNSARTTPFSLLTAGDRVRVPPFAQPRALESSATLPAGKPAPALSSENVPDLGDGVTVLARTDALLALAKPAGLPCQPGEGHKDSLSTRLASAYACSAYIPAPAHRIDRHTSGLVLAGLTHVAQRQLHELFAGGGIRKEYLAWVWGDWPHDGTCILEDRLAKQRGAAGRESMTVLPGGRSIPVPEKTAISSYATALPSSPGSATSVALAVKKLSTDALPRALFSGNGNTPSNGRATLLLLRLLTGRTHQLRTQLASRGFPIIGDGRYLGPHYSHMLLHAFSLTLPPEFGAEEYCLPPPWPTPFSVDAVCLVRPRRRMAMIFEEKERTQT